MARFLFNSLVAIIIWLAVGIAVIYGVANIVQTFNAATFVLIWLIALPPVAAIVGSWRTAASMPPLKAGCYLSLMLILLMLFLLIWFAPPLLNLPLLLIASTAIVVLSIGGSLFGASLYRTYITLYPPPDDTG